MAVCTSIIGLGYLKDVGFRARLLTVVFGWFALQERKQSRGFRLVPGETERKHQLRRFFYVLSLARYLVMLSFYVPTLVCSRPKETGYLQRSDFVLTRDESVLCT